MVIGYNVQVGTDLRLDCLLHVQIGDWVVLGNRVLITDNSLDETPAAVLALPPANRRLLTQGVVQIGENVLIEDNVRIHLGVSIEANIIVKAGSVISEIVPANAIVAGRPAQVIAWFQPAVQFP